MKKYCLLFLLSLLHAFIYANNECADAITLNPGTNCSYTAGSFSGATMSGAAPSCATGSLQDVWYKFTATDSTMSVELAAQSGINHGFEIIRGSCNGTVLSCMNNSGAGSYEYYFGNNFVPGQVYYVRVFNASAQYSTAGFQICVTRFPSPANDQCVNATVITPTTNCSPVYGTFSGAMMNGPAPSCAASASQDVWYKFTAVDSTMTVYLTAQSYINHGFEIRLGSCNGSVVACANANGASNSESVFNNNFIPGQLYYLRIFNASSALTTSNFEVCVGTFSSPANDQCVNATVITPTTNCSPVYGTFSGAMMNGPAPSCAASASQDVWYKFTAVDSTMTVYLTAQSYINHGFEIRLGSCNGTVVACANANGASNSESVFNNNFIPGQLYYLRIFNASSALTTSNFEVCVGTFSSPANDQCVNATVITPTTNCSPVYGTFSGAMMNGPAPSCAASASQDVWYKFTAVDSTMTVYLTAQSYINHGFEIRLGSCNGSVVACANANGASNSESVFNNNFIPGQLYYLRIFNASSALTTSNFEVCVGTMPSPANDQCVNATVITPDQACTTISGTFSGAMMNGPALSCAASASQDVWYKFTATSTTMSVYINAQSYINHGFELRLGSCNGSVVACVNANGASSSESVFNNNFIPGQLYYLRIFNASSSLTTSNFQFCVATYPPPANDQCANATELTPANTCTYTSGTFSGASADGGSASCAANPSQDVWYFFTATASTMSVQLNSVSGLNHGFQVLQGSCNGTEIICRNQNPAGSSESATLTTLVAGQTYFIRVFNAAASLSTMGFGICLTGPPPAACTPAVSITASSTSFCQGTSVTFTATPTNGGTSPSYQWKVNGVNVGTNSATYTTTGLSNGNSVTCAMTSSAACASPATVTSNSITVSVTAATVPSFTQVGPICSGESFTLPSASNNGINGSWSPAINNTTTTTYTFTPAAGQCASATTMTVTVNAVVTPSFNQVPAICSGESFTLPSASNNGINGTWSPAINNTATTTYTFTPAAGQCASATTMTVTVNSTSTAPVFSQVPAICSGESFTLPSTSNNGINGTWSPAINNTATTTYTFTPAAGQCASVTTMTVTVNPAATPAFTQAAPVCAGDNFTLPSTSNNGINGTWSPAINNTATTTYTFTPAAGQCASATTMTVTVNVVNTQVSVNGGTITALAAGASYQWIDCFTDQPVAGATGASFTPSTDGLYGVEVTQNNCTDISECTLIVTLGTETLSEAGWKLWPNPADDHVMIETNAPIQVVVTDLSGKPVAAQELHAGVNNIEVSQLPQGMYIVRSVNGNYLRFMKK